MKSCSKACINANIMLHDKGELTGGWEYAGDQIGVKKMRKLMFMDIPGNMPAPTGGAITELLH